MISFILRRVVLIIPAFIGVTLLAFALIHLIPGDPILVMAGERGVSPARHAMLMTQLGLDRPLWEQYLTYLGKALQGDLGNSIVTRQPVIEEFKTLFPATIELGVFAMVFAVLIGIPAGMLAAVKRGTSLDHGVMVVSLTGYSMPIFWWGLLLIMLVSGILGWTPVSGRIDSIMWIDTVTGFMLIDSLLSDEPGAFLSAVHHLILPAIVVGTIPLAVIARMTRSAMLEVLREDYVRTARAKGVSPGRVVMVHALRNALIPVITVIGLQTGVLLAGAILTETIFAWPGVGKWLVDSINRRDYPAVQGGILLISTVVILVNLLVDVLYGVINPRIRHRR
ncbi:ABC transporter permease subunit [Rhodospirillum rubrum]|uniref:Binding-protein-dependent transport systems inner membrane component n=1 Tax=Rhodospirillum rubrum (strain ATCC 11170 / ATH 1.1.1 / DSM 467 / LMG 4362 / NCIMB 8255 / S1) TaxID=269796 RepID=Q2RRT8_RHORT|nr:ABC transporter permease subunit [Rhodospirillum rubrum]ABC23157.1 Binding-protein-dependent transport systems inner membrane component [Rhodospirillum rubrum ATCC 11170]AEO48888.1 binding-protein dependent transport system inner membrane protein [Rhodospirillum rubrum F11]MBK5954791.1 peptide ABC transporter permease [Rhodospirillum rubrum]QXG79138.1 ABC transporter permease subunit [Rhodospirillum rubrum]HAQ00113.1 peptide ABC transporter permease [Rhodospirillum rubrum]